MKRPPPEEIPPRMWLLIAVVTFLCWCVVEIVTAAPLTGWPGPNRLDGPAAAPSAASDPEEADPCDPARQRARIAARDAARLSTPPN